jgi:hypothetical protein
MINDRQRKAEIERLEAIDTETHSHLVLAKSPSLTFFPS